MEDILKLMTQYYEQWEKNPRRQSSGYEYEKTFTEMWRELGAKILQQSVGELPGDKNQKKTSDGMGENNSPC